MAAELVPIVEMLMVVVFAAAEAFLVDLVAVAVVVVVVVDDSNSCTVEEDVVNLDDQVEQMMEVHQDDVVAEVLPSVQDEMDVVLMKPV